MRDLLGEGKAIGNTASKRVWWWRDYEKRLESAMQCETRHDVASAHLVITKIPTGFRDQL
jgi:hypothetical protein